MLANFYFSDFNKKDKENTCVQGINIGGIKHY